MMCNLLKNTLLLFLAILKLCSETYGVNVTHKFTLLDLDVICGITDGTSEVTTFPPQCTAIGEYTNDVDRLRRIYAMKGPLPFMMIIDTVDYNVPDQVDSLSNDLSDIDYDFVVLDLHKLADIHLDQGPTGFIHDYLKKIKERSDGAKVGLLIHTDVLNMIGKIEYGAFNDIADFFLLQSTGYGNCDIQYKQEDMPELAPTNAIRDTIKYLKDKSLDIHRLIYTIELKIESKKIGSSEAMGYSYLCSHKLSKDRRYCAQSVECLFDKARLRTEFNLTGVFIMGIEYDDVDGTCDCTTGSDTDPKFRGLKTIAAASQETVQKVDYYKCNNGAFPVILK